MDARTPARRTALLAALCSAQFLVVLDITAVNVALPSLRADLGMGAAHLHWVVSGYAVSFGGLLLLAGRLADLRGRRRAFVAGLSVFGAASLLCALAGDATVMLASRALQGVGAALLSPAALALLAQAFPEGTARTRALGVWGSTAALAASSGGLLGGALVETLGWRGIFLVNLPIAAAGVIVVRLAVPADRPRRDRRPLDAVGAGLATAGLTLLVGGLSHAGTAGSADAAAFGLLASGAALLAAFALWETRAADPLLPRAALHAPALLAANGVALAHGAMMLGCFFLVTVYMQDVLGLSAIAAGAGLLAVRGTQTVCAPLGARAAGALGARPLMIAGMLGMTTGTALLARAPASGSYARDLLPGLVVLGVAIPLVFLTVSMAALDAAGGDHAGLASGLLNTCQWVGGAIGIALASAVAAARENALAGRGAGSVAALAGGVQAGLWACAVLGVVGTSLALALPRTPAGAPAPPAAAQPAARQGAAAR